MKAIVSDNYGTYQNLKLVKDFPKPTISTIPKGKMIVKTQAVALAPGDCRVLSGACKELQGPPSFPYIPGGDLCGVITDMNNVDPAKVGYNVGDRVAARFTEGPRGALAEYAIISPKMTDKVPDNVSSEEAAALASSGTIALCLSRRISPKERVLVLGAGGGVGSHLCQFLRLKGVEYIAGVSSDPARLMKEPISCDNALNYTERDVFDFGEWKNVGVDQKFDTVIDMAGGAWLQLLEQSKQKDGNDKMVVKTAKEGGRYLALTPDNPHFEIHSIWAALKLFLFTPLFRATYSRLWNRSSLPTYTYAMSLDNDVNIMKETLALASENKLKACMDDRGPFDWTTQGAQDAFQLLESRHVRGKVIIHNGTDSVRLGSQS